METKPPADFALRCLHQWRKLCIQSPEFPHNLEFVLWECAEPGCLVTARQDQLTPIGLGGELTGGMRIIGPGGGPCITQNGGVALHITMDKDGNVEEKTLAYN